MAKEPSKKELYDAAEKMNKEEWHPIDKALEFLASKTPAGEKVPPTPKPGLPEPKKMAKGGTASSRADGCAQRGKTKGRIV